MTDKNENQESPINRGFLRRIINPDDPLWLFLGGILGYFGQRFHHPASAKAPDINYSGAEDERLFAQFLACLTSLGNDVLKSGLSGEEIEKIWKNLHQECLKKDHFLAENLRRLLLGKDTGKAEEFISAMAQMVDGSKKTSPDDTKKTPDDPLKGRIMRLCVRIAKETAFLIVDNGGDELAGYKAEIKALIERRALIVPKHIQAIEWLKEAIGQSTLDLIQKINDAEEALDKEQALQASWWHRYGIPLGFVLIFLVAAGLQYCSKPPENPCVKTGTSSKEIPTWCDMLPEPKSH